MKVYQMSITKFYSIKKMVDGGIFWRIINKDVVEIKPIYIHIRNIIEKLVYEKFN